MLCGCTIACNDTGNDTLKIGKNADANGLGLSTDVSTTGLKTPGNGVDIGYNASAYTVLAALEGSNFNMSAGQILVVVEYYTVTEA